eukprot:1924937-Prymnesium_polylepis.2
MYGGTIVHRAITGRPERGATTWPHVVTSRRGATGVARGAGGAGLGDRADCVATEMSKVKGAKPL